MVEELQTFFCNLTATTAGRRDTLPKLASQMTFGAIYLIYVASQQGEALD